MNGATAGFALHLSQIHAQLELSGILPEKECENVRQISIYEQEQRQSEEYPHGYVVRQFTEDLFPGELPYYLHELKVLALYDNKYEACDLQSEKDDKPEQKEEHQRHDTLHYCIVIDIGIDRTFVHVQSHAL